MPTTSNFGWTTPADTDLVKDGAAAIRTLGNGIDTSLVDLKGGTTGQILSKNSNTDLDYTWVTPNVGDLTEVQAGTGISVADGTGPIPIVTNTVATTFDAKGDLVVGTGADTFAKLTVGANGSTLVADSSTSTGLKWAAGGKILQVVYADYSTSVQVTNNTFTDTGLSATITPTASNTKILVLASLNGVNISSQGNRMSVRLVAGASTLTTFGDYFGYTASGGEIIGESISLNFLHTHGTASAITYKLQFMNPANNGTAVRVQFTSSHTSFITLLEVAA